MYLRTILFLLMISGLPLLVQAQPGQSNESLKGRHAYLESLSLLGTSQDVETTLSSLIQKKAGFLPPARRAQIANYFSFVLTLNKWDGATLKLLNEEGLDIHHAITADERPLVEQALLADFVIEGTVQEYSNLENDNGDLYRDIKIQVKDVHLGEAPAETIFIRQRNGREYGENPREAAELLPGKTYLLLLSNSLFRFGQARESTPKGQSLTISPDAIPVYYSIYRHYELSKGRVLWSGYNKRKTKKALKEIQWLNTFLPE